MTIEEYGTLSEEELIQEIMNQLEENVEIDPSELDFKFEDDKLKITGTLQSEDELEALIGVLEDYVDPKDYQCDVEILEEAGIDSSFGKGARFRRPLKDEEEDEEDEDEDDEEDEDDDDFEYDEEDELDEGEGDLDELEEEEDEDEDDNNKW
ncbi:MAG TPA: hypothetical protein VJP40_04150 [bacterium]|nr:hypothetical protein [bacterium]